MENLKKNVENINSGHARHPLAPDLAQFEGKVRQLTSAHAPNPAVHHLRKGKE